MLLAVLVFRPLTVLQEDAKKLPGAIFSCSNNAALNVTAAASPEPGIEGLGAHSCLET